MHTRSILSGATFLAVATLVALRWMAPAADSGSQAPALQPQAATPAKHAGFFDPSMPLGGTSTSAQEKLVPRWRDMQAGFARATSLRAFFYEAMRSPQDGGYYYAWQALGTCTELKSAHGSVSARRQQALDALRGRCDFSEQDADDALRQFGAIRDLKFSDDPLLGEIFRSQKERDAPARAQALESALASGHPGMIAALVAPAVQIPLGPAVSADDEQIAQTLLACRLGADCGPDSVTMLGLCARQGWCADSIDDALRAGLGTDYGRLDQRAAQAIDDIRKRNLGALVRAR